MIAFVTLLLGLISGTVPIEVTVSGPVARVELLLDGKAVRGIPAPPWRTDLNLGETLAPHELIARALDEKGEEIARTAQWINLPRPPAEVDIVLDADPAGKPVGARLSWQSVDNAAPRSVELTFDDQPLVVDAQRRAALPRYDLAKVHVLAAEVEFGHGEGGHREVVFGGEYGSSISTDLTAILLRVPKRGTDLAPTSLQGRLVAQGEPLTVAAVEEGPGKVLFVNVPGPQPLRRRWLPFDQGLDARGGVRPEEVMGGASSGSRRSPGAQAELKLGSDVELRLLSPLARGFGGRGVASDLFSLSSAFGDGEGGLLHHLTQMGLSASDFRAATSPPRIADAVAVAGLQAAAQNRRRAVVLILPEKGSDASRYTAETVKRYLAEIRVPLYVWNPFGSKNPTAQGWGPVVDVSTLPKLVQATAKLRADLETQRIAWVEGQHLPQSVKLAPGAGGVELVVPAAGEAPPQAAR